MGFLTTHILDTANGCPAAGVRVCVQAVIGGGERELRVDTITNEDGRVAKPLLEGEAFLPGIYEIDFHIGDYFAARNPQTPAASPAFLGVVTIRFGVSEDSHYHIPLLASPFGYSTYRGS